MEFLNDDVKRINLMFWSFILVYVFCEKSEMIANQFKQFEEELCQCKWYLYSVQLKRIYIIVVANAQLPTTVHGFGNIVCARESMKRVILYKSPLNEYIICLLMN